MGLEFCEQCHVNYGEFRYYIPGVIVGTFLTLLMLLTSLTYKLGWMVAVFSGVVLMLVCAGMGPLYSSCVQIFDRSPTIVYGYEEL